MLQFISPLRIESPVAYFIEQRKYEMHKKVFSIFLEKQEYDSSDLFEPQPIKSKLQHFSGRERRYLFRSIGETRLPPYRGEPPREADSHRLLGSQKAWGR